MSTPESQFNTRILGMMKDYQCTMQEALTWDFESFEFDIRGMSVELLTDEFHFYLVNNGLDPMGDSITFYTNIILGKQNFVLKKAKVK